MVEQDIREGFQIFRLEQVFYGASGQLGESLVGGAKRVYGPSPLRVSTSPAACTAATRVVKRPSATAVSTISVSFSSGRSTLSITWITPLAVSISVMTTSALSFLSPLSLTYIYVVYVMYIYLYLFYTIPVHCQACIRLLIKHLSGYFHGDFQ